MRYSATKCLFFENIPREFIVWCLFWYIAVILRMICYRADFRLAPSQWEMLLQSYSVSHWLGTNLESALCYIEPYNDGTIFIVHLYSALSIPCGTLSSAGMKCLHKVSFVGSKSGVCSAMWLSYCARYVILDHILTVVHSSFIQCTPNISNIFIKQLTKDAHNSAIGYGLSLGSP